MTGVLKCYSYMQLGYATCYLYDCGHIPEPPRPPFCPVRPLQQSYITMGGHKKAGQNICSVEWCLSGAATELMQSTNNAVEKGQWINGVPWGVSNMGFVSKFQGPPVQRKPTNRSCTTGSRWQPGAGGSRWSWVLFGQIGWQGTIMRWVSQCNT